MLSIGQIILRIFVFIYMIKVPEIDRTRNVKYEFIKLFEKTKQILARALDIRPKY